MRLCSPRRLPSDSSAVPCPPRPARAQRVGRGSGKTRGAQQGGGRASVDGGGAEGKARGPKQQVAAGVGGCLHAPSPRIPEPRGGPPAARASCGRPGCAGAENPRGHRDLLCRPSNHAAGPARPRLSPPASLLHGAHLPRAGLRVLVSSRDDTQKSLEVCENISRIKTKTNRRWKKS